MLSERELERYKRQMSLPGFGKESQEKLKSSTVLVAGIGGLGGTTAFYLAAAGVGKLVLVHEGPLSISNLNRQILMTDDWVGKSRVVKGKETLQKFNPHLKIDIYDEAITEESFNKRLDGVDLVVDCRHNFPERRAINKAIVERGVPMVEAAMNSMEAYLFNIIPGKTACLHCLYPDNQEWDPFGFHVLGAHSGALGCMAAVESVKILTGYGRHLGNEMLFFDLGTMDFRKMQTSIKVDCPVCGSGL